MFQALLQAYEQCDRWWGLFLLQRPVGSCFVTGVTDDNMDAHKKYMHT